MNFQMFIIVYVYFIRNTRFARTVLVPILIVSTEINKVIIL